MYDNLASGTMYDTGAFHQNVGHVTPLHAIVFILLRKLGSSCNTRHVPDKTDVLVECPYNEYYRTQKYDNLQVVEGWVKLFDYQIKVMDSNEETLLLTLLLKRKLRTKKRKYCRRYWQDPLWSSGIHEISGFTVCIAIMSICVVLCKDSEHSMETIQPEESPVEVSAVFINCEIDDAQRDPDNEDTRFEREELFKHNALRNCDKKLALSVKLTSENANSADEYVPVDHVSDGRSKKRSRLLNPYVLRIRRDAPLEAYKLKFIETVSGILKVSEDSNRIYFAAPSKRIQRDTEDLNHFDDWSLKSNVAVGQAYPGEEVRLFNKMTTGSAAAPRLSEPALSSQRPEALLATDTRHDNGNAVHASKPRSAEMMKKSAHTSKLGKRHEKNVVIEETLGAITAKSEDFIQNLDTEARPEKKSNIVHHNNKKHRSHRPEPTSNSEVPDTIEDSEKEFALYEVANPKLWFDVHVYLFEKLTTPKGNTLWNDITKGASVSVGPMSPEWSSSDMSAQYKLVDFIPKEEFLYPESNLRLLVPLAEENTNMVPSDFVPDGSCLTYYPVSLGPQNYKRHSVFFSIDKNVNFLLVPSKDVVDIDGTDKLKRTLMNVSTSDTHEHLRRVLVRITRALRNSTEDKPNIVTHKSEKYLTIPHRGKCLAQVDVEARADDNQLVHVSAPGRIAIIVADNTRGTRSTVTVQATNTGLVAARFRAQIRECDSGLNLAEKQDIVSEPLLLPPRHTRRLMLQLPRASAADLQHCSVYLLNGNNESVAVRDAVIKKGDQCFCVWHCDCVCYGDDSKLPCQEMSAAQQDAAGLPPRACARYTRATRYTDVAAINVAVVMVGVIGMLLCLGVLKGLLGLVCPWVGVWGMDRILDTPRQLDRYYESALRHRDVVYDDKSWPVHPDSRQRTVRVVSLPVEFILNVIFFVVSPGLIIVDALRQMWKCESCVPPGHAYRANAPKSVKINHADMQMFPLLDESRRRPTQDPAHTSSSDSEQDDTAFVLMQMQKSSESLARNQLKAADVGLAADTDHVEHLQADQGQTHTETQQS